MEKPVKEPQAGVRHLMRESDGRHYLQAWNAVPEFTIDKELPENFGELQLSKQEYWIEKAIKEVAKEMKFLINEWMIKNKVPRTNNVVKLNRHQRRTNEKKAEEKRSKG